MDIGQDIFETKTDPGATEWRIHDDVVRLREWGTEIIHRLPQAPWDSAVIGTAESCSRVQLIVCAESRQHTKPYHIEPIVIPPLSSRPQEIPRIIDEYADEAAAAVSAAVHLTAADRDWILRSSSASISEIEKGTRRLLAIRNHDDNTAAAARSLGMAPISLARWIGRRALPERRRIQVPTTPTRTRR